jgi:CheY-like chemotaxis protein
MITPRHILLVDDSPRDTEMAIEALHHYRIANEVVTLRDGAEALDYLFRRGPFANRGGTDPMVILLDLKMPKVDGLQVLREVKADPRLRVIPVVMMTSSREEQDLVRSYESGANAFWAMLNEPPRDSASPF